jgi:hypothetical protein
LELQREVLFQFFLISSETVLFLLKEWAGAIRTELIQIKAFDTKMNLKNQSAL